MTAGGIVVVDAVDDEEDVDVVGNVGTTSRRCNERSSGDAVNRSWTSTLARAGFM
jgi:hypothetical protein